MANGDCHAALLEGITIQQAGELIFDASVTRNLRRTCFYSYQRALGDFAFAYVLTDRFGVSGNLPNVGTEKPGMDLLGSCSGLVVDAEQQATFEPVELLDHRHPYYRRVIRENLGWLGESRNADKEAWRGWILREARSYLGKHTSLWGGDPESYEFMKTPKPYFHDNGLQGFIPKGFYKPVAKEVFDLANPDHVPIRAIYEFTKRSALTHVVIQQWYERVWRGIGDLSTTILPSPTRASLVARRKSRGLLDKIEEKLTPNILLLALDAPSRGDLMKHLSDLREQLTPLRKSLSSAILAAYNNEKPRRLKKIWSEVNSHSLAIDREFEHIRVDQISVGHGPIKGAARIPRHFLRSRYLLRQLAVRVPGRKNTIQHQMKMLFPELRTNN